MTTQTNLQSIALQLSHPDAFFCEIQANAQTVHGLFEAHEKGRPFSVSTKTFLDQAYVLGYISDYDEKVRRVYIPGPREDGTDCDALAWIASVIEFQGDVTQAILRAAVKFEFEEEVTRLAREIAGGAATYGVTKRIFRTEDEAFCDAVEGLAGIIRAANA